MISLSVEDIIVADGYLKVTSRNRDLTALIKSWSLAIYDLLDTYSFGYDDYINDLTIRKIIQEVVDRASLSVEGLLNIKQYLAPLDESFFRLTRECSLDKDEDLIPRWLQRVPIILNDDLKATLHLTHASCFNDVSSDH